jgi:hypothetical protein
VNTAIKASHFENHAKMSLKGIEIFTTGKVP